MRKAMFGKDIRNYNGKVDIDCWVEDVPGAEGNQAQTGDNPTETVAA
ncbi:hypothetical protein [Haloplanus rubicundus]|nr:hypothetical protein [Haloplanus rubicundus]